MKLNKQFDFPLTAVGAEECAVLLAEMPSKYLKDDSHRAALQENLKKLILNLEAHSALVGHKVKQPQQHTQHIMENA